MSCQQRSYFPRHQEKALMAGKEMPYVFFCFVGFLNFLLLTLAYKGRENGKHAVKCAVKEKTKRSPVFKVWKYKDHHRGNFTLHI